MKRDMNQRQRDAEIARDALTALKRDADVRHNGIRVTAEKGWLSLRGHAEGVVERSMVECVASCVPGVLGVTNLLTIVRPVSASGAVRGVGAGVRTSRGKRRRAASGSAGARNQPHAEA